MRRFSKLRQRGTQLADLIRITRKVFKFSKCCSTPKAYALAGSAAVRQLPSVRKLLIALECLENGRQTWSHSSACEENKKTGLIIIFCKSATTNVPEARVRISGLQDFSSNSSTQIAMFVRNFAGDVDTSSLCISGPVRAQGKISFNILEHLDLETIQKSIAESGVSASKVTRRRR